MNYYIIEIKSFKIPWTVIKGSGKVIGTTASPFSCHSPRNILRKYGDYENKNVSFF